MVRIALLSDIHFGSLSAVSDFTVRGDSINEVRNAKPHFEGLVETLRPYNVKYIFIAGDLTSTAAPHEFYFCQKKIFELASLLEVEHSDVVFTLGNHDVDWEISKIIKLKKQEKFEIETNEYIVNSYHKLAHSVAEQHIPIREFDMIFGAPYSGLIETTEIILYVLNSGWQCMDDQSYYHGKLSINQLKQFEEAAQAKASSSKWKIILLHHHPQNYVYPIPTAEISTLEEGSELIDIAGRYGIHIILHGHRHHPIAFTEERTAWRSPISFICAGSLSVNSLHRNNGEIPNTFHILELDNVPNSLNLLNFEYKSNFGWKPFTYQEGVRLEKLMRLGEYYDQTVIDEIINSFPFEVPIKWEMVDSRLKYSLYENICTRIKELRYPCSFSGEYPDVTIYIHKEDADNE